MKLVGSVALSIAAVGMTACEITNPLEDVDLLVEVQDAPVEIPASLGSVAVRPDEPTANSGTATNSSDIDRIEELRSIKLQPRFFSFTPASAVSAGPSARAVAAAQDGTIRLFLFLGGVPVPGTPVVVSIENGDVVGVNPEVIQIGSATVDKSSVGSFVESLDLADRPDLEDWQSMTVDEMVETLNTSLASGSIPFAIGVETTGDVTGTLQLSEIQFDAQVAFGGGG